MCKRRFDMIKTGKKFIAWISLVVLVLMSVMFSAQNMIESHAQTTKVLPKEKVAVEFIKSVYSDFRTIQDDTAFDKAIREQVATGSDSFKKLLKDKKYIHEQDDIYFNAVEYLISEKYKKPTIVFEDENSASMSIEAEYRYKEEYAKGPNLKEKDGEDLTSGMQVFYKVNMLKENGVWKIKDIQSNDLTAGIMFPNCVSDGAEWEESAYAVETKYTSGTRYVLEQKKEAYNVKEILERRKQDGAISKKAQREITKENSEEPTVSTLKSHGNFHKMYAKPLRNYQDKWWNKRNPKYKNYSGEGGDCTNYASQVLHAGGAPYDKTGNLRWSPGSDSWIRVVELRNYLLKNTYTGPFGKKVAKRSALTCGDLIQKEHKRTKHTVVIYKGGTDDPVVTAHSSDYKGKFIRRYGKSGLTNILVKGYYD